MTNYLNVLESKTKIRFHDCDPFNHLNNSKYIDYIISVREDQLLEHYDLDIYNLVKQNGVGWVAVQTQISYLNPAAPNEEVIIQTALIEFSGKSLLLEGIMWDSDKRIPKAIMWIKLVHFHLPTQKSIAHTEALMQLFTAVVNPVNTDFESRVKKVRQVQNIPVHN